MDREIRENLDREDLVAGMTGEDGEEISRDDLEEQQLMSDADNQDQLMKEEFGE